PAGPARPENAAGATLAMVKSQFEDYKQKWAELLAGPDSPLPMDKVGSFPGLEFYPYDDGWRFVGPLVRLGEPHTLDLVDNHGKSEPYIEYARFPFERAGKVVTVNVYRSLAQPEQFFVPFRDSTSGHETYDAGRYAHVDSLAPDRFVLDFNRSYNPYCAYASTWACPLVPSENVLPFGVRA